MEKQEICICGIGCGKTGICDECRYLLRAKRCKSIKIVEKFREEYNSKHGVYKSYGQFVVMLDMIDRRKRDIDNRRKKDNLKKIRGNR